MGFRACDTIVYVVLAYEGCDHQLKVQTVSNYAIVQTGGKQYRVAAGDTVRVESLAVHTGELIEVGQVLAISQDGDITIGTPTVEGAKVRAQVMSQGRDKKIIVFKYKNKTRYRRKMGHRQTYTEIKIIDISL